jgi:RNAse (barnase) inhibitor barstar
VNLIQKLQARIPEGGVFQIENRLTPAVLGRQAETHHYACFHLKGKDIQSKDLFLKAISAAMDFPAFFGSNWDALEDCITDLSWRPAQGYCLLYDNAGEFARQAPGDFATALEVFQAAADFWAAQKKPMWILLRDPNRLKDLEIFR